MSADVCVFAGQGAQVPGMGKDLAADADISALFVEAGQVLGFDLAKICFEGPADELTKSNVCQPAIFTVSVAAYRALRKRCAAADFRMAGGLSLGEWTALHVAGVLDFGSALKVLESRGRFMQEACDAQPSGMVSVMGATEDQVKAICERAGVTVANINSDSQVVLSGTKDNVASAAETAGGIGVKAIVLNVAGAFHSPLMASAREKLANVLDSVEFRPPEFPVLSNVSGKPHGSDPAAIKDAMLRQVTETVRWSDCVRSAVGAGAGRFVEFGPGKVLSGLIRRVDKSITALNVQDSASLEQTAAALAG
ncbi:MAG: ACP S-malonyltransferase [Kiritimatiellae bacterium]|nr:ACP S-malonyltransferase [Kiritimatiellia bacterium]MDD3543924.1 ACP S-malonyltransferase [Kiritimatiellia bacterium]MDD4024560.1 ACP S-malonyltransferase [Kiritimatiellia bacterium]